MKICWYCVFTAIAHESARGDLCTYSRAFRGHSNQQIEKRCFMYCDPPGPGQVTRIRVQASWYSFVCTGSCVQVRRYRSGGTHSCVQVRTYRFVCTDSHVQARRYRVYRFVNRDVNVQARMYKFARTDLYVQALVYRFARAYL